MRHEHDPTQPEQSIDSTRRRLAKAGLAAPAVLGVLASRPVLANQLHHCTPSGHISGFASPNPGATPACSSLGHPPSHYGANKTNWPVGSVFTDSRGNSRLFKDAPAISGTGAPIRFADAYQIRQLPSNKVRDATVWDVLRGCHIQEANGTCRPGWVLEAKAGFDPDISLGAEAITAAMNALAYYPSNFPIPIQQVVEMFNMVVVSGGRYQVTSTHQWNAAEVKYYLQSLHS